MAVPTVPQAAIIKGTVPGATGIDTEGELMVGDGVGAHVIDWGFLQANSDPFEFYAGALLVDTNGDAEVNAEGIIVVGVRNPAATPFIGRTPHGTAVNGALEVYDDPNTGLRHLTFLLPNFDVLHTRPGFVKGVHAVDDAQGLSHKGGSITDEVGRDECAP